MTALPPALALRRWAFVAPPPLAAALVLVGTLADPAPSLTGEPLWRLYAAHPEPLQIKSLALHGAFAFWFLPALLVAALVLSNLTAPGAALATLAHLGLAAAFLRVTRDAVDGAPRPA